MRTPPLLQKMLERKVGDLVVFRNKIMEPQTGCRIAYDFPSEVAAVNAALRMNEIADWSGIIKVIAAGRQPNCKGDLMHIAEAFGGKLATGATERTEEVCAKVAIRIEKITLTSGKGTC